MSKVPTSRAALSADGENTNGSARNATLNITMGACRLLITCGYAPVTEFELGSGRRVDIAGIGPAGDVWIVEVKSGKADFESDQKWHEYLAFADYFSFAVDASFPQALIDDEVGLIVADRFGGEIVRDAWRGKIAPARRKSMLVGLARSAAMRAIVAASVADEDPRGVW